MKQWLICSKQMCRSLFHPTISQSQWYVWNSLVHPCQILWSFDFDKSVRCFCKTQFQSTDGVHSSVVENSSEQVVTNLETTNSFCTNSAFRASNLWECVEKNSQPFLSWLLWLLAGLEVKQGILTLLLLRRRLSFRWKINTETPPYFKIYLHYGKENGAWYQIVVYQCAWTCWWFQDSNFQFQCYHCSTLRGSGGPLVKTTIPKISHPMILLAKDFWHQTY